MLEGRVKRLPCVSEECFGDMVEAVERCWMKVEGCVVEGKSNTDCSELSTSNFWRRLSLAVAA